MGLSEFARDTRAPVHYRHHVIDSSVLAWVFYERHHHGRLEPLVSTRRRKETRKKRAKALDIARCFAKDHAAVAASADRAHNLFSLVAGVMELFTMRSTGAARRVRSS